MSTKNRLLIPGYKRLEYIESTGTQWIKTGAVGDANITITAQITTIDSPSQAVLCSTIGYGGTYFGKGVGVNKWGFGVTTAQGMSNVSATTKMTAVLSFTSTLASGTVNDSSISRSNSTAHQEWGLFATAGGLYPSYCKVYECKISQNNTVVRNLIPVQRLSDSAIGMYDLVTKAFFGNSGTGTFIAGPEIKQVEYIESTGTQYINTGVIPNTLTDRIVADMQFLGTTSDYRLNGRGQSAKGIGFGISNNSKFMASASRDTITNVSHTTDERNIYDVDTKHSTFKVYKGNDVIVTASITCASSTSTRPQILFAMTSASGNIVDNSNSRCYSYKHYNGDDILVRDLIPVLVGTEYAMFDTVSGSIFRNSGTGSFTGGNVVPDPAFMSFTSMRLSRYANATSADTTKYPQTLNGWGKKVLDGTENWTRVASNSAIVYCPVSDGMTGDPTSFRVALPCPYFVGTNEKNADMPNYSIKLSITAAEPNISRVWIKNDGKAIDLNSFKSWLNENNIPFLYPLATSDGSVWNFVCDTAYNVFGYRNQATGEFVKALGATGTISSYNKIDFLPIIIKRKVPAEYQEVEYIESSGTQYIDTGVPVLLTDTLKTKCDYSYNGLGERYVLGTNSKITSNRLTLVATYTSKHLFGFYGWDRGTETVSTNTKYTAETITTNGSQTFTYDGVSYNKTWTQPDPFLSNLMLFPSLQDSSMYRASGKVYYLTVWLNGTLVRDFVPVKRLSDNEYGMYDLVTKQFFGNAGTGAFTGGPTVMPKLIKFTNDYYKA